MTPVRSARDARSTVVRYVTGWHSRSAVAFWSVDVLARLADAASVVINPMSYAEVSGGPEAERVAGGVEEDPDPFLGLELGEGGPRGGGVRAGGLEVVDLDVQVGHHLLVAR